MAFKPSHLNINIHNYSLYSSLYISYGMDEENLFNYRGWQFMENLSPRHPWGFKWLIKVIPQEKSYQTIFFKFSLNVANQFLFQKIQ